MTSLPVPPATGAAGNAHDAPALVSRPAVLALDAAYLVAGLPLGIAGFTIAVTGLALAAGLAITLAGIAVLLGTLFLTRLLGDLERRRAGWVLGAPVRRAQRPWTGNAWQRTKAAMSDGGAWRDTLWSLLLLPLGIAGFTAAVTLWSCAAGMLTSPLWFWSVSGDGDPALWLLDGTGVAASACRVAIGIALVPVAAWGCRLLAEGTARAARAVLGGGG